MNKEVSKLPKTSKRVSKRLQKTDYGNRHLSRSIDQALEALVGGSGVKFDETVDIAVGLGVDAKKSDQAVRGAVVLPSGTGKRVRVAVVASKNDQEIAQKAGADLVGLEDLIADISEGKINFDVLISTPDTMRQLTSVAKTLGPRGLMPNPKSGTVTKDVADAVGKAKSGQIQYRTDKSGIIHAPVGKVSFSAQQLKANIEAVLLALKKAKPAASKGIYLRQLSISSTMGRSMRIDLSPYR